MCQQVLLDAHVMQLAVAQLAGAEALVDSMPERAVTEGEQRVDTNGADGGIKEPARMSIAQVAKDSQTQQIKQVRICTVSRGLGALSEVLKPRRELRVRSCA
ncbi:MAG: hypothetical protein Q8K89_08165 [Actinomycetota bacterium]|nr:hypothetical protein [Actinomycetota bacterium]